MYQLTIYNNNEKTLEFSEISKKMLNFIITKKSLGNKKVFLSSKLDKVIKYKDRRVILFMNDQKISTYLSQEQFIKDYLYIL